MWRYYGWALGEQALGLTPLGRKFYQQMGYVSQRDRRGTGTDFRLSFPLIQHLRALTPPGGTVVDVGTGWFHHEAFLAWLVGDYRIYLFDVDDKARLRYIRNFLSALRDHVDLLVAGLGVDRASTVARLDNALRLESRAEVYAYCGFRPVITQEVGERFLPEGSVDFMVSHCVLNHIRPEILRVELPALRRMLGPSGHMAHLLGHKDHWSFHDRTVSQFNYYRYSDRAYRLFETPLEYQNRMVRSEWEPLFAECGIEVIEWTSDVTDASRRELARLPRIDRRFDTVSREELASMHSYILARPAGTGEGEGYRARAESGRSVGGR